MRLQLQTLALASLIAAAASGVVRCQGEGGGSTTEAQTRARSPATSAAQEGVDPRHQKAKARLREDLKKLGSSLKAAAHAFRGEASCRFWSAEPPDLDWDFVGASNGVVQWFALDEWRGIERGERAATARGEAPWGKPQGDAPEVPLSPQLLAPHLETATISLPTPSSFHGRPALRIHTRWQGKAATQAIYAATLPSSMHEQVLEAQAMAAGRGKGQLHTVDATTLYDPSTRRWLSSTLRFARTDGRPIPADRQPHPAPKGLPVLTSYPLFEFVWRLERCDLQEVPLPELNQRACDLLKIDKMGRPISGSGTSTQRRLRPIRKRP